MSTLGTNVEIAMQDIGISQAELAARSGLTPAAISQIVSGAREPMVGTLLKLCTGLRMTPNDLLDFHSATDIESRKRIAHLENKIQNAMEILE